MKRKVVKQGAATLTVSLPLGWAKKFKLDSGDELEVEERGHDIVVSAGKSNSFSPKQLDLTDLEPLVSRCFISLYINGHDDVKFTFMNPETIKTVQKVCGELIGFEVIESGRNYCVVKEIAKESEQDFDVLLRRLFLLLKGIFEDGKIALAEKKDDSALGALAARDLEINKFSNFCLRFLNKKGHKDYSKTSNIYSVVVALEQAGDSLKEIFNFALDSKPASKNVLDFYKQTSEIFNLCYELTFDTNKAKAKLISKKYDALKKELMSSLDSTADKEQIKYLMLLKVLLEKVILIDGLQLGYVG
jgi:phosphate uptake regulator